MTRKDYRENTKQLLTAIDSNFKSGAILPSLMLLYSTIDIMAWLNRQDGSEDQSRSDFNNWVNRYLLPNSNLTCNAIDLYAARCSVLHSYTSESSLSRKGQARKVYYTWGKTRSESLQEVIDVSSQKGTTVVVHIDSLIKAFRDGVGQYDRELAHSPKLSKLVYYRSNKFFAEIPDGVLV